MNLATTISFQIKSIPKESKVSVVEDIGLLKQQCILNENFLNKTFFYLNHISTKHRVVY